MNTGLVAAACVAATLAVVASVDHFAAATSGTRPSTTAAATAAYGRLPVRFEANRGQTDPGVAFIGRSGATTVFLTPSESVLTVGPRGDVLRARLDGANPAPRLEGLEPAATRTNYYQGGDPSSWVTDVPSFAKVTERNVYPGIDLVWHGTQQQLEYDIVVGPGADPARVSLSLDGATGLRIDHGDLVARLGAGELRQHRPVAYQELGGKRRSVPADYRLDGGHVTFVLGAYDHGAPLVIDPLVYTKFVGGTSYEQGFGVGVDATGDAYVVGETQSSDFPRVNALPSNKTQSAFVFKLDPTGTTLLYSTYLASTSSSDAAQGVAVDPAGNAYVTGFAALGFPTTPGTIDGTTRTFTDGSSVNGSTTYTTTTTFTAFDVNRPITGANIPADARIAALINAHSVTLDMPASGTGSNLSFNLLPGHGSDIFVTKLTPAGALSYSTYAGQTDPGSGGGAIAIDGSGNAYVAGATADDNFPLVHAIQGPPEPGTFNTHAVALKLNATGSALLYSTFLAAPAPNGTDQATGIAVDGAGAAYVVGGTAATNWPVTAGAYRTTAPGNGDAFVTKLAFNGTTLSRAYSTYLGGSGSDGNHFLDGKVAVDATGSATSSAAPRRQTSPRRPGPFSAPTPAMATPSSPS